MGNLRVKTLRVSGLSINNLPVYVHWIFILEGWKSCKHFVDKDSKCPPVDWLSVTLVKQDFWGYVFRSTTNSVSSLSYNFGKPKVNQFEVAVL